ncbi:sugar phosphate isomerase/epimerase [soil metagenome]
MKIGINLFLWTSRVGPTHYPLLRAIKQAGYDGVEIPVFEGSLAEYQELGTVLRDLGLGVTACTVQSAETNPISSDPSVRQAALDRLRWTLDRCRAMDVEILCGPLHSALGVFSGQPPTEMEIQRGRDFFNAIAPETGGVELAIEYLNRFENYFLTNARDAADFIGGIPHPSCGLMWDTFHAHIEEKSCAALRTIRDRLFHVHLSENDRGIPGTGQVHWDATFALLRELRYDRWLVIEAFGRALPDLAAATRVWRDLFARAEDVYLQGLPFIREKWAAHLPTHA